MAGQSTFMTQLVSAVGEMQIIHASLIGFVLPQSLVTQANWLHKMCSYQTW